MYIIENICSLSEPLLINSYFSSDLKNVIVQIQCKFGFIWVHQTDTLTWPRAHF